MELNDTLQLSQARNLETNETETFKSIKYISFIVSDTTKGANQLYFKYINLLGTFSSTSQLQYWKTLGVKKGCH